MVYDGTEVEGVSKGYMVGTKTMLEFFADEANCEKYFEAVAKNEVKVVLQTAKRRIFSTLKRFLKTQNNYWGTPATNALGWKANVKLHATMS